MINYKVSVDLATFFSTNAMARYELGSYNVPFCTIFVEAADPDSASHLVLQNFIDLLLKQHDDTETQVLCRKIRKHMRITRIKAQ